MDSHAGTSAVAKSASIVSLASVSAGSGGAGSGTRKPSFTDTHSQQSGDYHAGVSPASPTARSKIHVIESREDWEKQIRGPQTVLAYFSSVWCPPCRLIEPKLVACSDFYPSVTFVKIDCDDFSEIAQACEVEYTPTFQFFRNGEKFDEYVGSDAEQLRSQIQLAATAG